MNDLHHCCENADVTMYADDTRATTAIRDLFDITSQVIPDLIKINDWLKANRLNLNTLKTESMLMGTNWNLSKIGDLLALRISNDLIKRIHKAKYLGFVIDDKLSWKEHIGYISTKIRRNIGIMKRIKDCIPRDSLILLHRTLVELYFRYCNTTWGNFGTSLLNKFQTLQNRAEWVITGIRYSAREADHSSMLKDLNIVNVHVRQLIKLNAVSVIYRTENGLVPNKVKTWFTKCSSIHSYRCYNVCR